MKFERAIWKIFSIQRDELKYAVPLFFLYMLSGSFYALGQIFTETVFLKSYGAAGLSRFFMYNGVALIVGGIIYNYFFTRISLRKGYVFLVSLFTLLILSASYVPQDRFVWLPFYLYMGNYLFTFFLDIHFFNYAWQFCSLRSSKRILPFVMAGGKLGGILVSFLIYYFYSREVATMGITAWAVNGALLIVPLLLLRKSPAGGSLSSNDPDGGLVQGTGAIEALVRRIRLTYSSPIFLYSVLAVFAMSVANQLAEYCFARIFNDAFPSKNELAAFLSVYTFVADGATLVAQMVVISRLINAAGVRRVNYAYPLSFLGLIALALFYPTLVIGVLLRFYRKQLSVLIRTPVFNIIMAAAPAERLTAVKSFIGGIVSPLGMIAGGGAIVLIFNRLPFSAGSAIALAIGVIYVGLTVFQNRAYIASLRDRIEYNMHGTADYRPEYEDFVRFAASGGRTDRHLDMLEAIFSRQPSFEVFNLLAPHFPRLSSKTRLALIGLAGAGNAAEKKIIVAAAVSDPELPVRSAALELSRSIPPGERIELLHHYYPGASPVEHDAIRVLAPVKAKMPISEIDTDGLARIRLDELTDGVISGAVPADDLIVFIRALWPAAYLNHVKKAVFATGDRKLARLIIPHADTLNRDETVKVFALLLDAPIEDIVHFCKMTTRLPEMEKLVLLDNRSDLTLEAFDSIYANDESALRMVIAMLFEERNYRSLSNCLDYLISRNVKPDEQLYEYISYMMIRILESLEVKNSLQRYHLPEPGGVRIAAYLDIVLRSEISMHKHLILKAVSLLSGMHLDEVYDASVFLMDRQLNGYILEFLESYGRHTRQALFMFDDEQNTRDVVVLDESLFHAEFFNVQLRVKTFLPSVAPMVDLCNAAVAGELDDAHALDDKEKRAMLTLMEKIIFLNDSTLFRELNIEDLMHVAKIAREVELPRDSTFITAGESGDELFVVIDGEVEVFSDDKVIALMGAGNCIGELSIIDREPRAASVRTTRQSRLLSVSRREFLLTVKENPAIAINIMKVIADRLRKMI